VIPVPVAGTAREAGINLLDLAQASTIPDISGSQESVELRCLSLQID